MGMRKRMKKIKNSIGSYIYKYSGAIQLMFLLVVLIVGVMFPVLGIDVQSLLFALFTIMAVEVLFIDIKNDMFLQTINNSNTED